MMEHIFWVPCDPLAGVSATALCSCLPAVTCCPGLERQMPSDDRQSGFETYELALLNSD